MTHHEIIFRGRKYPVRLLAKEYSGPVDISLFFLQGKEISPCYQVAEITPGFGESAWMVGYPANRNGAYRKTTGKIQTTRTVGYEYEFSRPALGGESGGPLFVRGHKVVGIVTHRDGGDTLVTTLPQIRKFLTRTIGGVPKCNRPKGDLIVKPSSGLEDLINQISALTAKIEASEKLISILKSRLDAQQPQQGAQGSPGAHGIQGIQGIQGLRGIQGLPGNRGASGRITVVLIGEDGKEIKRETGVVSGSEVRLNKKTFLKKG